MELSKAELSILLTDDREIQTLNNTYRHVDKCTDVLSFPLIDENDVLGPDWEGLLGDVVISLDTAERYCAERRHQQRVSTDSEWSLEQETLFLLIHGVLHLIGFDHPCESDDANMQKEEARLFELLTAE